MTTVNPGGVAPIDGSNPNNNNNSGSVFAVRPATESEVSLRTLATYPQRALTFLTALSREPRYLNLLGKYGYDEAESEEGWRRLRATALSLLSRDENPAYLAAMEEIDAADEGIFKVVSATLMRRFPKDGAVILEGLGASTGAGAVMNMDCCSSGWMGWRRATRTR